MSPSPLRVAVVACLVTASAAACAADDPTTAPVVVTSISTTAGAAPSTDADSTDSTGPTPSGPTPSGPAATTAQPPPMAPDLNQVSITATRVADLRQPVATALRPGDPRPGTLYVAQRTGQVMVLGPDLRVAADPLVDVSSRTRAEGERGLLGLAFSPDGGRLYINYTDTEGDTNVDEFTVAANGTVDTASRRQVLFQTQPYANHNGGHLLFGADGYLYIGLGDGGSGGDPQGNAQNLGTLLGKMLRIDPAAAGGEPYQVPDGNPFVAEPDARPEIWSYGLRNPWRYSFDAATGDLWIADVGQDAVEEINVSRAGEGAGEGANYGWPAFEGSERYDENVEVPGAVVPIAEYSQGGDSDQGCSITGGVVYRGSRIPALQGAYLFADFCVSGVRAIPAAGGPERRLIDSPEAIVHFGEGADGEVYVLSIDGGVYRLDPR